MGVNNSAQEEQPDEKLPEGDKYFGFVNDSNICYANSAIQVLFHCQTFRKLVLSFKPFNKQKDYLVNELQELFHTMQNNKKNAGSLNTKKLMQRIKKLNVIFDNDDHHDSHEFLSWLLNEIHENLI
jgi:ubiquitin carboxyl-terminal hydrolase 12/46